MSVFGYDDDDDDDLAHQDALVTAGCVKGAVVSVCLSVLRVSFFFQSSCLSFWPLT